MIPVTFPEKEERGRERRKKKTQEIVFQKRPELCLCHKSEPKRKKKKLSPSLLPSLPLPEERKSRSTGEAERFK